MEPLLDRLRIVGTAEATGRYVHQTTGPNSFAIVTLLVEPPEDDRTRLVVSSRLAPGDPVGEYVMAIAEGAQDAAYELGIIGGRAAIMGGRRHEVDSRRRDFRHAGQLAFADGARKADLVTSRISASCYPRVRTVTRQGAGASGALLLRVEPITEERPDRPPTWHWSPHLQAGAEEALRGEMTRLAAADPPWVDLAIRPPAGARSADWADRAAVMAAVDSALAAAAPLERPRLGPVLELVPRGAARDA